MDIRQQLQALMSLIDAAPAKERRKHALAWVHSQPEAEREPWTDVIERCAGIVARGGGQALLQSAAAGGTDPRILAAARAHRSAPYFEAILGPWATVGLKPLRVLSGHKVGATALQIVADGPWISGSGEGEGVLRAWAPQDGTCLWSKRTPHQAGITSIAVDPVHDVVFTGGTQGDSKVFGWDLHTGKRRLALTDLNADYADLFYDATTEILIVADGALHGWRPQEQTKAPVWQVIDPADRSNAYVRVVLWGEHGQFCVLRLADAPEAVVEVRAIATGELLETIALDHDFSAYRGFPEGLLLPMRGQRLLWVPVIGDLPTCLWDRDGRKLAELPTPAGTRCAWGIPGRGGEEWIVFGDHLGGVHFVAVPKKATETAELTSRTFATEGGEISMLAATEDGATLVTAGANGSLHVWSRDAALARGAEAIAPTDVRVMAGHTSDDGDATLIGATSNGTLVRWRQRDGLQVVRASEEFRQPHRLVLAPNRPWVAMTSHLAYDKPSRLDVVDWESGACLFADVSRSSLDIPQMQFLEGHRLCVLDFNEQLGFVVDFETGARLPLTGGPPRRHYYIAAIRRPENELFLLNRSGGTSPSFVDVFDSNGQFVRTLAGHCGDIEAVEFAAGDPRVWTAATDGTLRMWSASSGECLAVFGTPTKPFNSTPSTGPYARVAVVPQRNLAVLTGNRKTLWVWDLASNKLRGQLKGHRKFPCRVVADPAGNWVLSADLEGTVILWDLDSLEASHQWWFEAAVHDMQRLDAETVAVCTVGPRLHILRLAIRGVSESGA